MLLSGVIGYPVDNLEYFLGVTYSDIAIGAQIDFPGETVSAKNLGGWHHFCVKVSSFTQEPEIIPKVAICVPHHWGDGEKFMLVEFLVMLIRGYHGVGVEDGSFAASALPARCRKRRASRQQG
jgi:hypothetical protein